MNTQQFPEIAKAVGAQRGGKYLKRVPKPGGGYSYVYRRMKPEFRYGAKHHTEVDTKINQLLNDSKKLAKDGKHKEAWAKQRMAHDLIEKDDKRVHDNIDKRFPSLTNEQVAKEMREKGDRKRKRVKKLLEVRGQTGRKAGQ